MLSGPRRRWQILLHGTPGASAVPPFGTREKKHEVGGTVVCGCQGADGRTDGCVRRVYARSALIGATSVPRQPLACESSICPPAHPIARSALSIHALHTVVPSPLTTILLFTHTTHSYNTYLHTIFSQF